MAKVVTRNGTAVIEDLWYPDDIRQQAESLGYEDLSMHDIECIMERVCEDFDANEGINWATIDNAIEQEVKSWD